MLVDGRWRMINKCRVDWSAQFHNTDHRLVATLKLQLKSGRMVPSQPWLDVGSSRMRGSCAQAEWGFGGSGCFSES